MGGGAVALDELRMATMTMDTTKEEANENVSQAVNVRQLAELAAAAAHRKSLDEDRVLGGGEASSRMNLAPPRRTLSRRSSSGVPSSRNGGSSGMRSMGRSFGNGERMISRTSSMHTPRSRGVHRSPSSDMSPMLSRSFARSGSHHRDADSLAEASSSNARMIPERGVRRAQSSVAESSFPRHAPERRSLRRSDSARAVPNRRGVGRTCSQNSLNHMSQNGAGGSGTDVGTLRPYRGREGLVNMSIQRSDSITSNSRQMNMLRRSLDDRSVGELSSFTMATMDSVNLRKQQIVADPIDDAATYRDIDSCADHDSVSMATNDVGGGYIEHVPERNPNHIPYDGVSVADSVVSGMESLPHSPAHHRILEDTKYLEDDTNHSRPNQIACDAVSLSTIGGEIDENDESSYESTLREELDEFDEDDGYILEGVKEEE